MKHSSKTSMAMPPNHQHFLWFDIEELGDPERLHQMLEVLPDVNLM